MREHHPQAGRKLPGPARLILHLAIVLMVFLAAEFDATARPTPIDPGIIEGEAGIAGCPEVALLAIGHVNSNHAARYGTTPAWYGWAAPSPAAWHYSHHWSEYRDPTGGAVHLFSFQDTRNPKVQALTRGMRLVFEVSCAGGTGLRGYR